MAERYPAAEPYESGMLVVTDGNRLYWEMCGAPDGTAAVYLHGGPGSGCTPGGRRNFDPRSYRAVLFDQRGCGRSRPSAGDEDAYLSTNTTAHLIGDIERLREHLGIDRWIVVGGSWGVTLGLAYAQRHPDRVIAMVLGAITAGTRREIDWITRDMGRVFPREWEQFVGTVPAAERAGDLCAAYARLLADSDSQMRAQAARQWCAWEDTHMSLAPGWSPDLSYRDPEFQLTFARLVTHYWSHGCFLGEGEILANMHRLADIPAVLIHGRYDISGPLDTAWRLHRSWPNSKLVVLDDAGHGGGSFTSELVGALDSFRTLR
ncbi:MAG: prolyl aminopeptidase [Actinomycetota bacterium]|nr:prolyl aminopeptidase [Actinomycetota bacterium]